MSFPMPAAVPIMPVSPIDAMIGSLNSNPYFIGTMMLMLNLGGRFIGMEMSKGQEAIFQNAWVRRLLFFTVLFVGTRNVMVAFWMSLIIILCIGYLFNENSSLCLFQFGAEGSTCADTNETKPISNSIWQSPPNPSNPNGSGLFITPGLNADEAEIYRRLSEKQARAAVATQPTIIPESQKEKGTKQDHSAIYWENLMALRHAEGFLNPRF